jgi:hypothetical protein
MESKPDNARPGVWTAAQIARALKKPRQGVQRALAHVTPDCDSASGSDSARAWRLACLPAHLVSQLEAEARRRGYQDAAALLAAPIALWQPPLPLSEVRPEFVERAARLRDALAQPLAWQHELARGALTDLGLTEFSRVFGYTISAKQWNRIFDRTLERASGCESLQRLDIYVDDAAFVRPAPSSSASKRQHLHRELDEVLDGLENRTTPTPDDRQWLFDTVFAHFKKLLADRADKEERRAVKNSLLHYLLSAIPCPGLAKTPKALRRLFDLKLRLWREKGCSPAALADERPLKSGNFRAKLCTECAKKVFDLAVHLGGNESQAYRRLRQAGKLCEPCTNRFHFDPRKYKSYVSPSIRESLTPLVDMCGPLHRGPWQARMAGPYIMRDWSGVQPGDYFTADDVTWNSYFWLEAEDGHPTIARGECLLMVDLRTGYPLRHLLIAGHYNGEHIRGLVLKTHDLLGLPHKGFFLERGVWRSRLVVGDCRRGAPLHWREAELGLREFGLGLELRHATTPRAKTIEGSLRILEERMRCESGFVGFNERSEEMERMQDFLGRARRGTEHPANKLLHMEEWNRRISAVLEEFAHDPQNGRMLLGQSPFEAWSDGLNRRPLRKLPADARYILATHKKAVTVRQEGILLAPRGKPMLFCNEQTGQFIGRQVLAFWNIECPDLLTVSDMKRQNYFTVKRLPELPAMAATSDQLAQVNAQIASHRKAAKALYGSIRHPVITTITRDTEHDGATKELGRFHNAEVDKFELDQAATTRKLGRIRRQAAVLGSPVGTMIRNPDRVLEGLAREAQVMERLHRKQAEERTGLSSQTAPPL